MKPLIEITTVPIQIEMKTTNAKLEYAHSTAEMEIKLSRTCASTPCVWCAT